MNLSWPSADSAWRRACRSPRFASVISRSTSGFTAFAFAQVVSIRSWSMSSFDRFIISALRCAESRESLCLFRWWRITSAEPYLHRAKIEPARLERLDDLFDRLATEVRDGRQLRLGLLQQVADRLDAGALEAVVRADAQLELLDQDVVHAVRAGAADGLRAGNAGRTLEAVAAPELLESLGIGEDRERLDQDLRSLAQGGLRLHGAVGLDVERELVVVGPLADASRLDLVGDALDR